MKTYEQLMTHYWGVIVPMAEAAGIDPWLCLKYGITDFETHPAFDACPAEYIFALTVLEKRPVFVGDKLWLKGGHQMTVEDDLYINTVVMTWTPPTKKRTFMLGDKELPCPDKNKGGYQIALISSKHFFSDFHDAQKVANAIDEILTAARDKE